MHSRYERRLANSRNALLRLVRGLPDPEVGVVPVLGVDDFALRRNRRYGTVLIDMDTHRPVDVLGDREADTFADWLRAYAGTAVVCRRCRGRSRECDGRDPGRGWWHLWHNLAEQVEKTVGSGRGAGCAETVAPAARDLVAAAEEVHAARRANSGLVARSAARFEQVQTLKAQSKSVKPIMRELGLAKETVRKDLPGEQRGGGDRDLPHQPTQRAGHVQALPARTVHRRGHQTSARCSEIREQDYRGSLGNSVRLPRTVSRRRSHPPRPSPQHPKVRHVIPCSHLDATATHVTEFAKILTNQCGERLNEWVAAVDADYDAVRNGFTLPLGSGAVEGSVNRIKMIKRRMYGRANFDLFRKTHHPHRLTSKGIDSITKVAQHQHSRAKPGNPTITNQGAADFSVGPCQGAAHGWAGHGDPSTRTRLTWQAKRTDEAWPATF